MINSLGKLAYTEIIRILILYNMPRNTKSQAKEISNLPVISIPGIQIKELLELEDLFPELRKNLCIMMFVVILIAQIRVFLSPLKPVIIQSLESVNTYIKKLLSKHPSIVYVASAVAIRKTMVAHAEDPDTSNIIAQHADLCSNLTGPVTTRGGLSTALGSAENLRAYRRGLMAQVTGTVQSTPIHSPRKIHINIEKIDPSNFLLLLPFATENILLEEITASVKEALMNDASSGKIIFNDLPAVNLANTSLESVLPIERVTPKLPDMAKIPKNLDGLPAWKKAAIQQARNFNTGGS
jgi:hypothetical protein